MNYYLIGVLVGAGAGYALSKKDREKWTLIGAGAGVAAGYLMTRFEGASTELPADESTDDLMPANDGDAKLQFSPVIQAAPAGGGGTFVDAAPQTYAVTPQTKGVTPVAPKTFIGGGGAPMPAKTGVTVHGLVRTKASATPMLKKRAVFEKTGGGTTGRVLTL